MINLTVGLAWKWLKGRALSLRSPLLPYLAAGLLALAGAGLVHSSVKGVYRTIKSGIDADWIKSSSEALEASRAEAIAANDRAEAAAALARDAGDSLQAAQRRIEDLERALAASPDDPVVFPHDVVKGLRR